MRGLARIVREIELPLARVLARMERTGVRIDRPNWAGFRS
jgi:DNA polymerase I-like protein with 3'-5' exonuclease and polymerase domains